MAVNIASVVQQAIRAVGSQVEGGTKTIVLRSRPASTAYDPITGAISAQTTSYTVQAVITGFSRYERASSLVRDNDMKALIALADLPASFAPSLIDTAVIEGRTWNVRAFERDPTLSGLLTLTLREPD